MVTTFVFAAYVAKTVAADPVAGTSAWSHAIGAAALAVALAGPVLGAVADRAGRRKPWQAVLTLLCVVATALLWFVRPDPADLTWALVWVAVATFAFETGTVFYNAMLPDLIGTERLGRWSGWGWGIGYAGGLCCLVLALVVFIEPVWPLFVFDKEQAEHVRATAFLVAGWFALFALPLFLWTPDAPRRAPLGQAVSEGLAQTARLLRRLKSRPDILRFLLAQMLYMDGLNTLFAFGGIYAAGTFGMGFAELLMFGIALNVTGGLGAAGFAWLDDGWGAKRVILVALGGLILLGGGLLVVEGKTWFWILALPLGLFVGPAQSASRSLMARLAPAAERAEMFGLQALSGKATAFAGPLILGAITEASGSQRLGMVTVLAFFVAGAVALAPLGDKRL